MKYNICVIGLGSVGGLRKDSQDLPGSSCVLTHCHAACKLKEMGYVKNFYVHDISDKKTREAATKWNAKKCYDINKIKGNIDIFVVAVNTEYQYDVTNTILESKHTPKMIIVEKPFCNTYFEALEIQSKCKKLNIVLGSNYVRRFSSDLQALAINLYKGVYGKIMNISLTYTRGLQRDGSHAIDFLNSFLGKFNYGAVLGDLDDGYDDFSKRDKTLPVYLNYEKCKNVVLLPADGRNYGVFEMNIYTEKGKITLDDHFRRINIFRTEAEKNYGKFQTLELNFQTTRISLERTILLMHLNCVHYLDGSAKLYCSGNDAVKVRQVLHNILGR